MTDVWALAVYFSCHRTWYDIIWYDMISTPRVLQVWGTSLALRKKYRPLEQSVPNLRKENTKPVSLFFKVNQEAVILLPMTNFLLSTYCIKTNRYSWKFKDRGGEEFLRGSWENFCTGSATVTKLWNQIDYSIKNRNKIKLITGEKYRKKKSVMYSSLECS